VLTSEEAFMQAISPGANWLIQVTMLSKQTSHLAQFADSVCYLCFHKMLEIQFQIRIHLFKVLENSEPQYSIYLVMPTVSSMY